MMKKWMIAATVAVFAGSAVALAAPPVTDFYQGSAKVSAEYIFNQGISGVPGHSSGYEAALEAGLTDNFAVQYAYTSFKRNPSVSTNEITGIYRVSDYFNAYGSMLNYHAPATDAKWSYQMGVVGHTTLSERVDGFAKVGFGNKLKSTVQIGASYAIRPNVDFNLYYQRDNVEGGVNMNGFHAGVGFSF